MLLRLLKVVVILGLAFGVLAPDQVNASCLAGNGNVKKGMYTIGVQPITSVKTYLFKRNPYLGCTTNITSFTLQSIMVVSSSGGWFQFGSVRARSSNAMTSAPFDGLRWWVQIRPPPPSVNIDSYYGPVTGNANISIEREYVYYTSGSQWEWVAKIEGVRLTSIVASTISTSTLSTGLDVTNVQYFGETSFNENQMGGFPSSPGEFNLVQIKRNSGAWEYVKNDLSGGYYSVGINNPSPVYVGQNFQYGDQTWRIRDWSTFKAPTAYLPSIKK